MSMAKEGKVSQRDGCSRDQSFSFTLESSRRSAFACILSLAVEVVKKGGMLSNELTFSSACCAALCSCSSQNKNAQRKGARDQRDPFKTSPLDVACCRPHYRMFMLNVRHGVDEKVKL
jgi:hypothetical protein